MKKSNDPRRIQGSIIGPGGPHDKGGVILDARNAVLLETVNVSTVDPEHGGRGQSALALQLGGRINQTKEHVNVLFITGTDGAAAIITELIAVYGRATGDATQFVKEVMERFNRLKQDGHLK